MNHLSNQKDGTYTLVVESAENPSLRASTSVNILARTVVKKLQKTGGGGGAGSGGAEIYADSGNVMHGSIGRTADSISDGVDSVGVRLEGGRVDGNGMVGSESTVDVRYGSDSKRLGWPQLYVLLSLTHATPCTSSSFSALSVFFYLSFCWVCGQRIQYSPACPYLVFDTNGLARVMLHVRCAIKARLVRI